MNAKAIFLCHNKDNVVNVYGDLMKTLPLDGQIYTKSDVLANPENFKDVNYIFSTWGMPAFTEEEIERALPSLKALFYAAGTVQAFAAPFLNKGVRVFSAWQANAIPVAEYTLAQVLLANKGFYITCAQRSAGVIDGPGPLSKLYPGNYGATVGLIGLGMIGKKVAELLKQFKLKVLVFDAFMSAEKIAEYGAEKVTLSELFERSDVVSNHLANNAATKGMLNYELFKLMPKYSTFINTGRGAQVVEADLVRILTERPDITAVLDVTDPEPPKPGHEFYTLQNCFLTPHIAGSSGDEVKRMGEYMEKAYLDTENGVKNGYEVSLEMLKTMA